MNKKKIENFVYFADFETSYINKKQAEIDFRDLNGKNVQDKIASKNRYVWLYCIKDINGKTLKTLSAGENTLKDFLDFIINITEENKKKNPKAKTIIFFHNLKYDWSYIQYYVSTAYNGIRRGCKNISYEEIRDDSGLYQTTLFIDEKANGVKYTKVNGKKCKKVDKDGNEIKKYIGNQIIFRDTYKLFPISIKEMGDILNKPKLDEDKSIVNGVYDYNYRANEKDIEYCERDVEIMCDFYNKAPEYAKIKMTLASNSINYFKEFIHFELNGTFYDDFKMLFPKEFSKKFSNGKIKIRLGERYGRFNGEIDFKTINEKVRDGYTGGVCQVNSEYMGCYIINKNYKDKNKLVENLKKQGKKYIITDKPENILDVNSLYPHIMKTAKIPYGKPVVIDYPKEDEIRKLAESEDYFVVVEVDDILGHLKPNKFATIPASRKQKLFTSSLYLRDLDCISKTFNYEEFQLHKQNYNIIAYDISRAYIFRCVKGVIFNEYIDFFANIKENASKIINEYKRDKTTHSEEEYINALYDKQMAKLFMNTLYGKFGSNAERDNNQKYYSEKLHQWVNYKTGNYYLDENGEIKEKDENNFIYPTLASAITSYARLLLFDIINRIPFQYFIYCDTDSVHFIDNDIYGIKEMKKDGLIDDNILGKWKLENETLCSVYLAPKKYAFINEKDKLEIKCAGLPDDAKNEITTIENFYYGYSCVSKLQTYYVKGGIDLLPTNFVIKAPDEIEYKFYDKTKNNYLTIYV